jgi:hypothetical protein
VESSIKIRRSPDSGNMTVGIGTRDAARPLAAERVQRAGSGRPFVSRAVLAFLLVPLLATLAGLPYYRLPLAERLDSPLHPWFRPSGIVGQTAGFVTLALFLFLWLYPIRKRLRFLSWTGSLGRWLDVHVVVGLLVPVIGAVHAAWRFEGLIGLGYGAMLVVALSGVIGRYLYMRIPRARDGLALTREEVAAERRRLLGEIIGATPLSADVVLRLLAPGAGPASGNLLRTVARMAADDVRRRLAIRRLRKEWKKARGAPPDRALLRRVSGLARREMALSQQIRMLDQTNRVFRFWHAAHRPFAATAFFAVAVHVIVVVALGATWIG